jgi:eukaryotic-like serine/threonine-protein kinase
MSNIGPYHVVAFLGRGGSSEVLRVRPRYGGEDLALKILHPELAIDDLHVARFRREADTLARVQGLHPSLVELLDRGEAGGRPYLVMELLPGGTLRDRIASGSPVSSARVISWLTQAAEPLDAIAEVGLSHRDVKPLNLMFAHDDALKLTDFGIVDERGSVRLIRPGWVVGTPPWAAPEQMAGARVTAAADRYALGVVALELVTGKQPLAGDKLDPLISQLPPAVGAVIRRATAYAPRDRYPSAASFVRALDEALVAGAVQ